MFMTSRWQPLLAALLAAACSQEPAAELTPAPSAPSVTPSASASAESASPHALDAARFRRLIDKLSEPDANFFSDNHVSNETSYLQVANGLERRVKPGGVYLGVGPEQNFTYIALVKPSRAYIIDIRRDNLVLMLLYKAIFDVAVDRSHFLALLTGRPYDTKNVLSPKARIDEVIARAEREEPTDKSYKAAHATVLERIERAYGMTLDARDRKSLATAHRAFFDKGLDIRFELKEESFRRYPPLRELLAARCPIDAAPKGFLARDESFRFVQRMQRENRIVPIVGDFAGERAVPNLAAHLKEDKLTVSTFYVSNVEQYLLADGVWWKWRRNVALLPTGADSLFVRAYLDQGKPHPKQLAGHRTTTTLQRIADFHAHERMYPSMLALATDRLLE
jgi:hypothetical protein